MSKGYDHRGRRTYKGAVCALTILQDLGELRPEDIIEGVVKILTTIEGLKDRYARRYTKQMIGRLCDQGFIEVIKMKGAVFNVLTERGKKKLAQLKLGNFKGLQSPWDGKWRMLVFDIEEESRHERNLLRNELKEQGFVRLQNSVWVYPHECYDYVALLKTSFSLGDEVLYAVVEKLENDNHLLKHFGLRPRS